MEKVVLLCTVSNVLLSMTIHKQKASNLPPLSQARLRPGELLSLRLPRSLLRRQYKKRPVQSNMSKTKPPSVPPMIVAREVPPFSLGTASAVIEGSEPKATDEGMSVATTEVPNNLPVLLVKLRDCPTSFGFPPLVPDGPLTSDVVICETESVELELGRGVLNGVSAAVVLIF